MPSRRSPRERSKYSARAFRTFNNRRSTRTPVWTRSTSTMVPMYRLGHGQRPVGGPLCPRRPVVGLGRNRGRRATVRAAHNGHSPRMGRVCPRERRTGRPPRGDGGALKRPGQGGRVIAWPRRWGIGATRSRSFSSLWHFLAIWVQPNQLVALFSIFLGQTRQEAPVAPRGRETATSVNLVIVGPHNGRVDNLPGAQPLPAYGSCPPRRRVGVRRPHGGSLSPRRGADGAGVLYGRRKRACP